MACIQLTAGDDLRSRWNAHKAKWGDLGAVGQSEHAIAAGQPIQQRPGIASIRKDE